MRGLEPPRRWHWFLRPARLPVPPHPHFSRTVYILAHFKDTVKSKIIFLRTFANHFANHL